MTAFTHDDLWPDAEPSDALPLDPPEDYIEWIGKASDVVACFEGGAQVTGRVVETDPILQWARVRYDFTLLGEAKVFTTHEWMDVTRIRLFDPVSDAAVPRVHDANDLSRLFGAAKAPALASA